MPNELLNVTPDCCATIEDFSESWNNRPWREHQSQYWVQMGVTLFGMMLFIHIDNLHDISKQDRVKLKKLMKDNKLPPIVIISCIIISADLTHDAASVFHYNDELFTPWLLILTGTNTVSPFRPGNGTRIRLLDGATHFKSAGNAYWVSSQHEKGPRVDNTYRATGHGKDLSDGECGGLKNMASREQGNLKDTGGTSVIKSYEELYNFAEKRHSPSLPRSLPPSVVAALGRCRPRSLPPSVVAALSPCALPLLTAAVLGITCQRHTSMIRRAEAFIGGVFSSKLPLAQLQSIEMCPKLQRSHQHLSGRAFKSCIRS